MLNCVVFLVQNKLIPLKTKSSMVEIHVVIVRFHHGVPDWSQAPQVTSHPTPLASRHLQNRSQSQVWWAEGWVTGFDECMNHLLDDAERIPSKAKPKIKRARSCRKELLPYYRALPTRNGQRSKKRERQYSLILQSVFC